MHTLCNTQNVSILTLYFLKFMFRLHKSIIRLKPHLSLELNNNNYNNGSKSLSEFPHRNSSLFFKMEDISTSTTRAESPITTDAMNPLWGFIEGVNSKLKPFISLIF